MGVIATTVAVFVALGANWSARKQLRSALKMQEQSKNVGLLDKRLELAEKIQAKNIVLEMSEVLERELRILFDNDADIIEHYTAWKKYLSDKNQVEGEILSLSKDYYEETVIRDHPELGKRKTEAERNAENEKQMMIQCIERFISDSIESLEQKPKRKFAKREKGDRKNDNHRKTL